MCLEMAKRAAWAYLAAGLVGVSARLFLQWQAPSGAREYGPPVLPKRQESIQRLKRGEFDILIIGGGAVGAGVALEAASRGLKCALIDKGDFAGQTSSKSTKLLHGGVRYLEQAAQGKNVLENLHLITEALRERSILVRSAPQMCTYIPLVVPLNSLWQCCYYYLGLWTYHLIAKGAGLVSGLAREPIPTPYALTSSGLKSVFPALKREFMGGVVYFDGQMNDSRLCLTVLLTAGSKDYMQGQSPACIANYCACEALMDNTGRICGAVVRDLVTNESFQVSARVVINCTGPFSDSIRHFSGLNVADRIVPAKGSHLIMASHYTAGGAGLLIPKTKDGRLLFLLPWHGHTLAGTTDQPAVLTPTPSMSAQEQQFMLEELGLYLGKTVAELQPDVLGSFSGLRPLVRAGLGGDTKELARSHEIELMGNGLMSVMGGKWTTFRSMGKEAVDLAVERFGLEPVYTSRTDDLHLIGYTQDSQSYQHSLCTEYHLPTHTAKRLVEDYGTRAEAVLKETPDHNKPLIEGENYLESEVIYAVRREFALKPLDVLCRRLRLGIENQKVAQKAVLRVIALMGEELGWSAERMQQERAAAVSDLAQFATFQ